MALSSHSLINPSQIPCDKILRQALSRGGDFAELFFEKTNTTRIRLSAQKLDSSFESEECGVGLRVIHQLHTFYAYTSEISPQSLFDMASRLSETLKCLQSPQVICLPLRRKSAPNHKPRSSPIQLRKKIDWVRRCDAGARQNGKKITDAKINYRDQNRFIYLVNSEGLQRDLLQTHALLSAEVVVQKKNVLQTGSHPLGATVGFEMFSKNSPEQVGRLASEEAKLLLESIHAPVGTMPVLLAANAGGTFVHEAVGHALEADCAEEGFSIFSDLRGKQIACPEITVIDDPTLPDAYGSFAYDDEGTPAQKTVLVENGILRHYLYDRFQAIKHGQRSTGNGRRESYQNRPLPRMSNIYIVPGKENPDALLRAVPKGLYVEKMGGGEVDPVSGTFIFEVVKGFLIVNGQKETPVRGATLIGDCRKILKQKLRLGNDFGFSIGTCGKDGQDVPVADAQPTLLIPEITVGGKGSVP